MSSSSSSRKRNNTQKSNRVTRVAGTGQFKVSKKMPAENKGKPTVPAMNAPARKTSTNTTGNVERRQFSMGRDSIERLENLRQMTGATSHSEVIRNALRTYQYLSQEEAAGHRVLIEQDDGTFVRLKML